MHGCSWTNIMTNIAGGAGSNNWMIAERLRSLKSLFFIFQDPAYQGTANARSSHRLSNKLTQYQLKIGSTYYPPQQVKVNNGDARYSANNGEFLNEAFKAIGEYCNNNHSSMVNIYNFGGDVSNNPWVVSRAVYALDLDAFGRSEVESGCNTILNSPITVNTVSSAGYANPLNVINLLYHDVVFAVSPDGSFTLSK
jgi:hypothetical protein